VDDTIQNDLNRLEKWAIFWFNLDKCQMPTKTALSLPLLRLRREVVDAPSLEVFRARLDGALSNMV